MVAVVTTLLGRFQSFQYLGGTVSTAASALFLLSIAILNIFICASVYRSYRWVRAGGSYVAENIDILLNNREFLVWLYQPLLRLVTRGWHMFVLGLLFERKRRLRPLAG